jgi:CRP/FNR family cyclic AMP-dependent transcriptional regulator
VENLERVLLEHDFLKGLSDEQASLLVSCVKNARFSAGEFLMREGEPANTFYLLRKGSVAMEAHVPGRGAVQMESLGAGDMLGLSWAVPPYRIQLDARAIEPVVALAFDGACLRRKMEEDHELGFVLLRRLFGAAVKRLERVRLQRIDVYKAG